MADTHGNDRHIAIATFEQVVDLVNDLRIAFDQEPQLPPSVENRRERLSAGIRVVAKFVGALVGLGPKYADPFDELASVLTDLNAGVRPELVVPANYMTRRPDPSQVWRARAHVVRRSALPSKRSLLLGGGHPMCSRKLRQNIPASGTWPGPRPGRLHGTLSGWRKEFRQNRVQNSEASDLFAIGGELIESRKGDRAALREIARLCLRRAKRVFSPGGKHPRMHA